ncbi:biotin/lipoyl-binding protein [Herbaspirillum seropedicae]|uniref:ABC-type export system, membrane fusion protein n=1 Tax=Herbaspirillum seropedicae (strain SmR1) TaxID=757424 RepID=D8IVE7_HERSS|nr:biotin/lipoyl-binding protein [Herbaspirillum seropedicae]ADJ63886.1 ABC-type export system, membrane fusion protein [Herbaspirillum seropedicae SmR1]AKN65875.1 glycosyl hydrolase family 18 [Herbaspirillum seropedicae]NQE29025.1 glycosyl hydrolase family 18 [Herbaspirillum seropedicae]UMU21850.1 biotin/lipoyl-binding protein [Herbaspirillum seropedicae]
MKSRAIFVLAGVGLVIGLVVAWLFSQERKPQPPAFAPIANPYGNAIHANGIIESEQGGGVNIPVYPELPGRVIRVLVHEGQHVSSGAVLIMLDDTVQRASTEQARLQAEAAQAQLAQLKAQPRPEALAVARAQVVAADANRKTAQDQFEKRRAMAELDARTISKDALDTAENAWRQAQASLEVAQRQYELIRAGSWSYDLLSQQRQVEALTQSYDAATALLQKYTIRASGDGIVLALNVAPGSYVSAQGVYDGYTQAMAPPVLMGSVQEYLAVRCYVDEMLVSRLPPVERIDARMALRGSDIMMPLQFVRIQPYVSPKIALSNQRQERVDLRVLPILFRFRADGRIKVYPGQLVDVFIGQKK